VTLAARSLLAVLALPGVVAGVVPLLLLERDHDVIGPLEVAVPLLAAGLVGLAWTVLDFALRGHGTLAPIDAPSTLVTTGLHKVVRNPMYVAVLAVLAGEAVLFASATLAIYALVVAIAFHLRVVIAEEPALSRAFGDEYAAYRARVPRWVPSLRR
jgi:protein-S-isoprenylcysteine O-methyltransferase Ste14